MKTNHEKVVASWDKVLEACNAHGSKYNPRKASLKVTALKHLLTSAQESLEAVDVAGNRLILAINDRQRGFNGLPMLGTRIINALAVTDASAELIADANRVRLRFRYPAQGTPKAEAEGQENGVSASDNSRGPLSQLDYDSKLKNLKALIGLVESEPTYQPFEADLQTGALKKLLTSLRAKHKAVAQAELALGNARIVRNKALFDESGIFGRVKLVKKYAKTAFGTTSPEFRYINSIRFRR